MEYLNLFLQTNNSFWNGNRVVLLTSTRGIIFLKKVYELFSGELFYWGWCHQLVRSIKAKEKSKKPRKNILSLIRINLKNQKCLGQYFTTANRSVEKYCCAYFSQAKLATIDCGSYKTKSWLRPWLLWIDYTRRSPIFQKLLTYNLIAILPIISQC